MGNQQVGRGFLTEAKRGAGWHLLAIWLLGITVLYVSLFHQPGADEVLVIESVSTAVGASLLSLFAAWLASRIGSGYPKAWA